MLRRFEDATSHGVHKRAPVRGKWLLGGGCVVLLAIVAGVVSHEVSARRDAGAKAPETKPATAVAMGPVISLSGRIQARHTINVPVPISGKVEAFQADVGQEVFEGQLIAQIRSQSLSVSQEEADAAVERAQEKVNKLGSAIVAARLEASRARADASRANSEYTRAQRTHQRQKMLLSEGATPRVVAQKAEREFLAAEQEWNNLDAVAKVVEERVDSLVREHENAKKILSQLLEEQESVKAQLSAGEVHSPVNGVVVGRRGEEGGSVDQSLQDMFQIAIDLTLLQCVVEADPGTLPRVQPGQQATVHVAEMPGEALPGVVQKVDGNRVIIEFTSPNPAIKPGLTAQASIRIE